MHEDQQLKGGNLALLNSIRAKNPVRVIRGCKLPRAFTTYFYDGLYTVEKMWEDKGLLGKRVFKFKLVKMTGQASHALGRGVGVREVRLVRNMTTTVSGKIRRRSGSVSS